MLDYFRAKTRRQSATVKSPVLNDEDEAYFAKLAGEETPPALPARPGSSTTPITSAPKNAQIALMNGADQIPLPTSPPAEAVDKAMTDLQTEAAVEEATAETGATEKPKDKGKGKHKGKEKEHKEHKDAKPRRALSTYLPFGKRRQSQQIKESDIPKETKPEAKEDDLTTVLDQLNLSAVNNRAFSFSKESQELMQKFTLVLKDIVHGAPHAYDDLEKLLTREEAQLNKLFNAMPPFLQSLIKSLPAKIGATIAPELLAASSEKPGADMQASATSASTAGPSVGTSSKSKIPSLKSLVSAEGAVATMLRSILNFLKLRFPTVMTGTNVLVSLAVFILLFVFWYCHKRGRQERLKQGVDADVGEDLSASDISDGAATDKPATGATESAETTEPPITFNEGEGDDTQRATVDDLPSVLDLPEPASVPLPKTPDEGKVAVPPLEK